MPDTPRLAAACALTRMTDGAISVTAAIIGSLASLLITPQLARFTASPAMIGAGAVLAWVGGRLAGSKSTRLSRARLSAVMATFGLSAVAFWILQEPSRRDPPVTVPASVPFWNLPTGSRIAYRHFPAESPRRATPVIMLHGGPGLPAVPLLEAMGNKAPYDTLAALGFDVYWYDQYGAGYSSRADLAREAPYTVARHVEDLEAIRATIGAERLILIGSSWGATLAANYLLRFLALRERTLPVLVLRGACDWIKPEIAEEYRDVFPSARLVEVPGAGHATWFEQPALTQRLVAAFLLDAPLPTAPEGGGGKD